MAACVLALCEREADAGPWCRQHWDQRHAHQVMLHAGQSVAFLAEALAVAEERLEFVGSLHEMAFGQCCGHLATVHTHGGCTGLSGGGEGPMGQDGWYACSCTEFDSYSEEG